MKTYKLEILIVVVSILSLVSTVYSQEEDYNIIKEYDKFSKKTVIILDESIKIENSKGAHHTYSYLTVIYGDDTTYLFSISGWRGVGLPSIAKIIDKVLLLIDGNLIELNVSDVKNSFISDVHQMYWYFDLPKSVLTQISNGKVVDVQITNKDFILEGTYKSDDLKIMKSFLKKY